MEIFFTIIGALISSYFLKNIFVSNDGEYLKTKRNNKRLKKSIEQEFLYERNTRNKITIEQAISGNWENQEHDNIPIDEKDLKRYFSIEEEKFEKVLNYIKGQFEPYNRLNTELNDFLKKTIFLIKYKDWHYSNLFIKDNKQLIFIIKTQGVRNKNLDGRNTNLFFWINIKENLGHYILINSTFESKKINFIFNNEPFDIKNYNIVCKKESSNK